MIDDRKGDLMFTTPFLKCVFIVLLVTLSLGCEEKVMEESDPIRYLDSIAVLNGPERPHSKSGPFRSKMRRDKISQSFLVTLKEVARENDKLWSLLEDHFQGNIPPRIKTFLQDGVLNLLFDLGYLPDVWIYNYELAREEMENSEIPKEAMGLDFVIISHLHDTHHQGGLEYLVEKDPSLPIFLPTLPLDAKGIYEIAEIAPDVFQDFVRARPSCLIAFPEGYTPLTEHLGVLVLDFFEDDGFHNFETLLILHYPEDKITILSGCSHPTPYRVIKEARAATGKNVDRFIGGTEWRRLTIEEIRRTLKNIRAMEPNIKLFPNHCTGWKADIIGSAIMGINYQKIRLGQQIYLREHGR